MKFTRVKTTLMAGVMAASMLAPGMTAFAADGDATTTAPSIKKTVTVGNGITIDDNIVFTAKQVDSDAAKDGKQNADGTTQPIDVADTTFTIAATDINASSTKSGSVALNYTDENNNAVFLDKLTADGEYTFLLTETAPAAKAEGAKYGWTIDDEEYFLHIYRSTTDGTTTYEYMVTTSNSVTTDAQGNKKYDEKVTDANFKFENTFTKDAGKDPTPGPDPNPDPDPDPIPNPDPDPDPSQGGNGSLAIYKSVAGDSKAYGADKTYTFKVVLTGSADNKIYDFKIGDTQYDVDGEGNQGVTTYTVEKVTLKNGESAIFDSLPAGISVTVTETDDANIDSTNIKYMFDGGIITKNNTEYSQYSEVRNTKTVTGTLGEKANIVKFINNYKDVTVTGVVTSTAPYVTLVVVAVAAVAAYVVMKRRVAR